ncbi:MAG: DUF5317 family protein [Candidatus Woesearchaeota archaeon]
MEKTEEKLLFFTIALIVVLIGLGCNFLAIQNGGKMPVFSNDYMEGAKSDKHFEFYDFDEIKFPYTSDIFFAGMGNTGYFFSVGDIFLLFGGFCSGYFGVQYAYLSYASRNRKI